MDAMLEEAEELKKLAAKKPRAKHFAVVEAALHSKWEGNQSIALQTLQAWGDKRAISIIRAFLESAFDRKTAWSVRGVAIKALASLIGPEDAQCINVLQQSRTGEVEKLEFLPLMRRLAQFERDN